jgi:hypothetical protein
MSDSKEFNNRLDYVERQRLELEDKNAELSKLLASVRSENTRLRAVSRDLAGQLDTVGEGLTDLLQVAAQASEDKPGSRVLAARVRQARASLDLYTATTGGQQ